MELQWYPGHMTKAKRMMQEDVSLVDLVIELLDARIPVSSRNPDIDELGRHKSRLVLLNKSDLANDSATSSWIEYFRSQGQPALQANSKNGLNRKAVQDMIRTACQGKLERDRKKGINRPVRAMVCGIPNVGKSAFINALSGKAGTKTGNKPGVTKGKQWIRLNGQVELLDTPGILWPKFEDEQVGIHLAMVGSIKEEILPVEELAGQLIALLEDGYPDMLEGKYHPIPDADPELTGEYAILAGIAKSRGCLKKGNTLDLEKAARLVLDDFRNGRLGRVTLEYPPQVC